MVLDESAKRYLKSRRSEGVVDVAMLTPAEARVAERAGRQRYGNGPDMAHVEELKISTDTGFVRTRLLCPGEDPANIVIYFHGGGWVVGDIEDYDALLRTLAVETESVFAAVEYRKAPESPFPAAVTDAIQSVNRIADHAHKRFPSFSSLMVAGDSAGGNLAAVVAQAAASGAVPSLALQILLYPILDCDFTTPSYEDPKNQLLLTRQSMQWFWDQYVPDPENRLNVMASPARARTLVDVPPALIIAAGYDVLRSEGKRYAERLECDGIEIEYVEFDGQMHGFFSLHNVIPESAQARHLVAEAIRKYGANSS